MNSANKDCPCVRSCPNRNEECHGYCKKYKDWCESRIKEPRYYITPSPAKQNMLKKTMKR